MTGPDSGSFPRRDAAGRIVALTDLLGVALAGVVIGALVLILFDSAFLLIGRGRFGQSNGWLAVILPAWLFVDDFRSWRGGPARFVAGPVALGVGVTCGLLTAGLATELPPLAGGASAATVFTLVYALVWFHGVRWLDHRTS